VNPTLIPAAGVLLAGSRRTDVRLTFRDSLICDRMNSCGEGGSQMEPGGGGALQVQKG